MLDWDIVNGQGGCQCVCPGRFGESKEVIMKETTSVSFLDAADTK